VVFAAFLHHWGHKGPAEIPPKREFTMKHVLRIGHRLGHRVEPPPEHPFNPILALRVACLERADRLQVIDTLFRAVWDGGPGISEESRVVSVLNQAGFPGEEMVAQTQDPSIKAQLKANTDRALAAGVFGVPTVQIDGENFWGVESYPDVEMFSAGKDPVDPALLQRWASIPAAATRKGG